MSLMTQGGAVSVIVAVVLLLMSIASWVVILWKAWLLKRAVGGVARSAAAFWQSASVAEGAEKVALFDREALLLPLIAASNIEAGNTLATRGDKSQQLTRMLRDALHKILLKLQYGQVLLATVGSSAWWMPQRWPHALG
jgi:biopolymer transport protein ExbB